MGYDFYGFTSSEFEDLVQAIFQKIFGYGSLVYGQGADGARELTFKGKAQFESTNEIHDGLWIIQAKFKSRDIHTSDQYSWVRTQFLKEMEKFQSGKYPLPDQYIFVTNCVLTPTLGNGGRDKMQELIKSYQEIIPRIYIVSYDELSKMLLNNLDVRQAFHQLLHPGDQFAEIKKILTEINPKNNFVIADKEIREIPSNQSRTSLITGPLLLNIDFGTSFSLCSVYNSKGDVELVPNSNGDPLLPSIVSFFSNGCYIVGNRLLKGIVNSEIISISNVKRYLGTGKKYTIFGRRFTAEQIATLIVKSLKVSAEEFFGFEFDKVIVSKPSNYNVRQTKALHQVFENAGMNVSRMIDEGSAPSSLFPKVIHENSLARNSVSFLVLDLGGGTFDLSIQEYSDDVIETKAVLGDNLLGGIDFDNAILELAEKKFKAKYPELHNHNFEDLLLEAERVKKNLTHSDSCSFILPDYSSGDGNLIDLNVIITRSEFRQHTSKLNTKMMQYLMKILDLAQKQTLGSSPPVIDAVMLTGQGSKIFTIKEIIDNFFPNTVIIDRYMENAVCLGNAHQAGVLTGYLKNTLSLNVQNTSLGILTSSLGNRSKENNVTKLPVQCDPILNTKYEYLIKGSTTIPCKNQFILELSVHYHDTFTMSIYEFSNSDSEHEIITEILVPVLKGQNNVLLTLDVDANFRISITVKNEVANHHEVYQIV